jgi:hypothetical protein
MGQYYAVVSPTFQRAMRNILSITRANPAVITTTFNGSTAGDHDYSSGLIVRIMIPEGFGMSGINEFLGPITVTSTTTFTIDIDTSTFDAFVVPAVYPGGFGTAAQVIPVGELNDMLTMATQNVLPYP